MRIIAFPVSSPVPRSATKIRAPRRYGVPTMRPCCAATAPWRTGRRPGNALRWRWPWLKRRRTQGEGCWKAQIFPEDLVEHSPKIHGLIIVFPIPILMWLMHLFCSRQTHTEVIRFQKCVLVSDVCLPVAYLAWNLWTDLGSQEEGVWFMAAGRFERVSHRKSCPWRDRPLGDLVGGSEVGSWRGPNMAHLKRRVKGVSEPYESSRSQLITWWRLWLKLPSAGHFRTFQEAALLTRGYSDLMENLWEDHLDDNPETKVDPWSRQLPCHVVFHDAEIARLSWMDRCRPWKICPSKLEQKNKVGLLQKRQQNSSCSSSLFVVPCHVGLSWIFNNDEFLNQMP